MWLADLRDVFIGVCLLIGVLMFAMYPMAPKHKERSDENVIVKHDCPCATVVRKKARCDKP